MRRVLIFQKAATIMAAFYILHSSQYPSQDMKLQKIYGSLFKNIEKTIIKEIVAIAINLLILNNFIITPFIIILLTNLYFIIIIMNKKILMKIS